MHDRVHSLPAQDHAPRQPADQKQMIHGDEEMKKRPKLQGISEYLPEGDRPPSLLPA